ncbi:hypothetical protein NEUTE1DRAFT_144779 [Neurospora tetrasperma FGSC 2508]|uniref:C2H2-type domain-containing protein n=1 Tax=Neurospora tetrasperma (strain FGSC 2508 / ATCC MYA-4615 / P0657) TaxID=510951 RepID=F8MEQ2_NEUT8|nr:uncharacterized protein NEUTE1DRAFT_144779 [Neurospora tetrasperma FGSC 2508]EGO61681.1 hypothetical protein NEUTE1DRAFT_144779 [Neurospora tetrasperma FGSC 2508]EGZ74267.1 hypothetical protein NEUTE2DRAFT_163324 [Neurospora tetrasperma FGSC 2509]
MPLAGADMNRKRPIEGGADNTRLRKRRSQGFTAPSSNSASTGEFELPALISLADASRRYDEWKGDIGDGVCRTLTGGGAYFPTNYKLFLKHPAPWLCPLVNCRKSFAQCSSLGHHFSKAHRGLKLYDEAERGLFHPQGMRIKPDKDGKLRPIVVARGFGAPDDDQQAPAALAANRPATANSAPVRPLSTQVASAAAPTPTTARAVNNSASTPTTSAQATNSLTHDIIDIVSDDEDVQLVLNQTLFRKPTTQGSTQRKQPRAGDNNGGAGRSSLDDLVHDLIPDLETDFFETFDNFEFEVDDSQPAGGAQQTKNILASSKRERGIQSSKKASLEINKEANVQLPKLVSFGLDCNVDRPCPKSTSSKPHQDGNSQRPKNVLSKPNQESITQRPKDISSKPSTGSGASGPNDANIWEYLRKFLKPGTQKRMPEDAAIQKLLALPRRRELPTGWQFRLRTYEGVHLTTLIAIVMYLGGDESPSSPCSVMGCREKTEGLNLNNKDFRTGRSRDARFAFPVCVMLPQCLSNSDTIHHRLNNKICCNAYFRWCKVEEPDSALDKIWTAEKEMGAASACSETAKVENDKVPNATVKCSRGNDTKINRTMSKARPYDTKSDHVTPTIQPSHHSVPLSGSRLSLPNGTSIASAKHEERNSMISRRSNEHIQPSNARTTAISTFSQLAVAMQQTVSPRRPAQEDSSQPATVTNARNEFESQSSSADSDSDESEGGDSEYHSPNKREAAQSKWKGSKEWIEWKRKMKKRKLRRAKDKKLKKNRQARRDNEKEENDRQVSLASQTNHTPVSAAAASFSNLTVQDTSTTPSRAQQQGGPEESQKTTVFNIANGSTQPIGFKGGQSQLIQASKRQTLECTVWAGSVRMKMIGDDGMSITRRVDAEGTWTVGPDSHCLVSNFFPAAKETAVVNVKSKSVSTSIG